MAAHRARFVLLPEGLVPDTVVEEDGGRVTAIRPARAGDPPAHDGTLVPGLVNAHLHLELSWLAGAVPATARGFDDWVGRMLATRGAGPSDPELPRRRAAEEAEGLVARGTVAVGDVSGEGWTAAPLAAAGLRGVVFHELLGFGREQLPQRLEAARADAVRVGGIVRRPAPHAVYSTPGELIVAACGRRGGAPSTIHCAEDAREEAFLHGEGPAVAFLDRLGLDWRWSGHPRTSPVGWLDRLGVLGPDLLVVHGVHLSDADRATLAARGAPLCLCPRSNLHIGGRLADVPALLAAGVPLALGTDSLASCEDLDVLGEIPLLALAFPEVDPTTWLRLATSGGADALGLSDLGRIAAGSTPGLVLLHGVEGGRFGVPPERTWLSYAAGATRGH
ncbi:MAG: amidohydrolase family protein [Alphaproteobacteria bacterium]|nr:amidohydrolase family protein [Alphaproteobacteria bacterium]MCB9699531.1 amidohydrolase family protein [Alphaproteobacteria bacterium]